MRHEGARVMRNVDLSAVLAPSSTVDAWRKTNGVSACPLEGDIWLVPLTATDAQRLGDVTQWLAGSADMAAHVEIDEFAGVGTRRIRVYRGPSLVHDGADVDDALRPFNLSLSLLLRHSTTLEWAAEACLFELCGAASNDLQALRGLSSALGFVAPDGRDELEAAVRALAAFRLGQMRRAGRPALPALYELLRKDAREAVVRETATALVRIGAEGVGWVCEAIDATSSPGAAGAQGGPLRWSLVFALSEANPEDAAAVCPLLASLLRGEDSSAVRAAAAEALGRLDAASHVEGLVRALLDDSPHVRYRAAEALGHAPHLTDDQFEALELTLADSSAFVRAAADAAIQRLRGRQDVRPR